MTARFDALVVGDARFQGGTTAAMVADVTALSALGARVGLMFVRSSYLDDSRDPANPAALALRDLEGVTCLAAGASVQAELAFLHHPLVFFRGIEEQASLTAERSVVITHHPPFRADGSLEYDPIFTRERIHKALGLRPWFAPVSHVIRTQLQSFAPLITLTENDWPNTFDTDAWQPGPEIFSASKIVIGRHGRADGLKWPSTAREVNAALPASADVSVRVLGCPTDELEALGADLRAWDICPFGSEQPQDFLHSLDVFAYHYHPNWVEAFGRTIAEAALCRRLCLLDPRLEPTFGDIGLYCEPEEVADRLAHLRANPLRARAQAARGETLARRRYGLAGIGDRLEQLRADGGSRARQGASVSPLRTARKLAGLYRRRTTGATG